MQQLRHVGVIGAGLMGHGIAQVFALAGHSVTLTDARPETLEASLAHIAQNLRAMGIEPESSLQRIALNGTLRETVANADIVIEAASENIELKQDLFADIARHAPRHTILASNTSVIPIALCGAKLAAEARTRLVGTHWWNPPHLVPLVEVVRSEHTSDTVFDATFDLLLAVGKRPVKVQRDVPGFIGNRLQHAMWREAMYLVESGVCDAETIDTVIKNSFGLRMAVLGPMENADLVGLELIRQVHDILFPHLDCAHQASALLSTLLDSGKKGMSTGEGLRSWTPESSARVRETLARHLIASLSAADKIA